MLSIKHHTLTSVNDIGGVLVPAKPKTGQTNRGCIRLLGYPVHSLYIRDSRLDDRKWGCCNLMYHIGPTELERVELYNTKFVNYKALTAFLECLHNSVCLEEIVIQNLDDSLKRAIIKELSGRIDKISKLKDHKVLITLKLNLTGEV